MTPEQFDVIYKLTQTGLSGVLLTILFKLWGAFERQNKFIRDMLIKADEERSQILHSVGANEK